MSSGECRALDSFTLDYIHLLEDGSCTPTYERFLGCQIAKIDVNSNNNGQGVLVMADSDIVAQKRTTITSTDFRSRCRRTIRTRTLCIPGFGRDAVDRKFDHQLLLAQPLDHQHDSAALGREQIPVRSKWRERQTTLTVSLLEKNNDLRDAFEAQTALSVEYNYNNGTDNLKIDLNTRNYVQSLTNNRPLSGDFEQTAVIRNRIDPALNTDHDDLPVLILGFPLRPRWL